MVPNIVLFTAMQRLIHQGIVCLQHEMNELQQEIQGSCFDTEYAVKWVLVVSHQSHQFTRLIEICEVLYWFKPPPVSNLHRLAVLVQIASKVTASTHLMGDDCLNWLDMTD